MVGYADPPRPLPTNEGVDGISVSLMNPIIADLSVSISSTKSQAVELTLFSLSGQVVERTIHRIAAGETKLILPLPAMGPGQYYLHYSAGSDQGTLPVVKM